MSVRRCVYMYVWTFVCLLTIFVPKIESGCGATALYMGGCQNYGPFLGPLNCIKDLKKGA